MRSTSTTLVREIRSIRQAARLLSSAFANVDAALAGMIGANGKRPAGPTGQRRKLTMTLARRKALKLQGRYIGTIRLLPPAKKEKARKIRNVKGVLAAIAYARSVKR